MNMNIGVIGNGRSNSTLVSAIHKLENQPQECDSDLISRNKLLEDARNTITEKSDSLYWFNLIYNQPQVQPIARSAEEIEKIVEAIYINMDCDDCPNRKKCSKIGANISCKDYWTAYLTGKEV